MGGDPLNFIDPLGLVNTLGPGAGPGAGPGGNILGGSGGLGGGSIGGSLRYVPPPPLPSPMQRSVPMNAPPNSCFITPKGDVKVYDRYGNRSYDLDFSHPHDGLQPHVHNWTNGIREIEGLPFSPLPGP